MTVLALYKHITGWKTAGYWYSSEMSLGWEFFVGTVSEVCTGAVLALVQNVTRLEVVFQYWGVTANGIVPVPKVCTGAVLDLVPKLTCLYYT